MNPISVHVPEATYAELRSMAARAGRPLAELIREALAAYVEREQRSTSSLRDLAPHASGVQIRGWTRDELYDEMRER